MQYINTIKITLIREKIINYNEKLPKRIGNAEDAHSHLKDLSESPQEIVKALYLNTQNEVIGNYIVSKGTVKSTLLSAADVIRPALLCGASGIIIGHNHPSGETSPSSEDIKMTEKLKEACNLMDIKLLDHLIIGDDNFTSMNAKGYF